jgi:hypothetical protein
MSMLEFGRVAEDGGHVDGRGFLSLFGVRGMFMRCVGSSLLCTVAAQQYADKG